ncbi:hypothetical protein CIPAW_12G041900 [Carya illinoinensis]|uniref:uracil phosphoribosyltransferase n=1 Tax=Carya illinoinensis TaxID=32201 RepID=A0A8T1NMT0_CARIL|nr:hypothetical protein CIPAW_12G041900 [Carya illinoinensis]
MISDRLLKNSQPRLYTDFRVVVISQDSFYHERSLREEGLEYASKFNFDDPDAFDMEKLLECIKKLKSGQSVQVPHEYNFKEQRYDSYLQVDPCNVLILKGTLLLQSQHVRSLLDMKIFIDTDADVRLAGRIKRDTSPELGRNVTSVLEQMLCLHTLIRDKQIGKHEFIFHADRLARLVVERGLACFPSAHFTEKQVTTPLGEPYKGCSFSKKLFGVSINRIGQAMENALRACCAEVDIGFIFGTRPEVVGTLPEDISKRHILLLDPVLASGKSAIRAIELLKNEGKEVHESQIILLNIICAKEGIEKVCKKYPELKVVTSAIDVGVNEQGKVIPGIGDFGGRYYGTNDI